MEKPVSGAAIFSSLSKISRPRRVPVESPFTNSVYVYEARFREAPLHMRAQSLRAELHGRFVYDHCTGSPKISGATRGKLRREEHAEGVERSLRETRFPTGLPKSHLRVSHQFRGKARSSSTRTTYFGAACTGAHKPRIRIERRMSPTAPHRVQRRNSTQTIQKERHEVPAFHEARIYRDPFIESSNRARGNRHGCIYCLEQ